MAFVNTTDQMSEQEVLDGLVDHTLPELHDDKIVKLANYAFFRNAGIEVVDLPNCKTTGSDVFSGCTNLQSVNLPACTSIGSNQFESTSKKLGVVSLPNVTRCGSSLCRNSYMAGFDFAKIPNISSTSTFSQGYGMFHLVLRHDSVCPLSVSSPFQDTPIGNGFGYIYVPEDLVDDYKVATNWSAYADQILPIEGNYPKTYMGTIGDSWAQIFAAEQDGSYRTKYQLGDTKAVMINGEPVIMQIVAMDTDVLASNNSQTAPITWVSLCKIEIREVASSGGGWGASPTRTYLRETILPSMEETVRSNIKEVLKTYRVNNPSITATIADTIWIPSVREVGGSGTAYIEDSGVVYSEFFTGDAARLRHNGLGLYAGYPWDTRSQGHTTNWFYQVDSSGQIYYSSRSGSPGLIIGFCT